MQTIPASAHECNAVIGGDPQLPPGRNVCRCAGCGEFFLNVRAFDRHRYGPGAERVCVVTPRMAEAGLERDPRGYWRLPKREYSRNQGDKQSHIDMTLIGTNTADAGAEVAS